MIAAPNIKGRLAALKSADMPAKFTFRSEELNCAVDQASETAHNTIRLRLAMRYASESSLFKLGSKGSSSGTSGKSPECVNEKNDLRHFMFSLIVETLVAGA